jgi:hypothetical protein
MKYQSHNVNEMHLSPFHNIAKISAVMRLYIPLYRHLFPNPLHWVTTIYSYWSTVLWSDFGHLYWDKHLTLKILALYLRHQFPFMHTAQYIHCTCSIYSLDKGFDTISFHHVGRCIAPELWKNWAWRLSYS